MKDLEKIEALLDKYFRGETSTEEEDVLRRFFEEPETPPQFKAEAELFRYFARERSVSLSQGVEDRLDRVIADSSAGKPGILIRWKSYWIGTAAAVILILLGIFLDLQIRKSSPHEVRRDTYEDPYLAYAEAKKVLYLVSDKINAGTEPLKSLEKLNAGKDYMQPVFSFGTGVQHLDHFTVIEKTRKLIAK